MAKSKPITDFFTRSCQAASSSSADDFQDIAARAPVHQTSLRPSETSPASTRSPLTEKPFHPKKDFKFPKTKFASRERSCQSTWFESYEWLHYNQEDDSVTCFICATEEKKGNLQSERNKDDAYIKRGFRSWKKAPKCFDEHQRSSCHKTALSYHVLIPQCGDVMEMTIDHLAQSRLKERLYFIKVMESVQYLARQGIAFQGSKTEGNDNFTQLMLLRGKDDPSIVQRLQGVRGDKTKYTHTDYQNELLSIMANQAISKILDSVRENGYFALACDEYTDVSNKEQLAICVRSVDSNLDAREDFLGFYEVDDIGSNTIVATIKDALIRMQLSLSDCRGQTYDGASTMLGRKTGVAAQLSSIQPKALVTHCHGHSLSLAVKDLTSECKVLADTMGTVGEICVLVKYSPKREKMLGSIQENVEGEVDEEVFREESTTLDKLCVTRWTVRATCFLKILKNYDELFTLWEQCLKQKLAADVKARIIGCDAQMQKFSFYFGLSLGYRLYSITDNLSKTLQCEKMSSVSAQRIVRLTVETLEGMRNEEHFKLFFETVVKKAKKHSSIEEPRLPRKRKRPDYSVLQYMEGYGPAAAAYHPQTVDDHYRPLFFEAVDMIVASIKDRFDQPSYKTFAALETMLLNVISDQPFDDEIQHLHNVYGDDVSIESLKVEFGIFKQLFSDDPVRCFHDIHKRLKKLESEQLLMPNIIKICKLLLVNPATSATPERSFSMARRVKTWQRATMTQKRFNALSILNCHKDITDMLNLVEVGNHFVSLYQERYHKFGLFQASDFHR